MTLLESAKRYFKTGDIVIKIIFVNIAVFLVVHLVNLLFFLFQIPTEISPAVKILALPAHAQELLYRPWSIITYMFLQEDILHILFNMLILFWFGKLFLLHFRQKQLWGVYFLGGIAGGLLYFIAYNIFPAFDQYRMMAIALGASASVIAIVIAIASYKPDISIHLLLLGKVQIKYIAVVLVIVDIVSIPVSNAGGHIAHLGGAIFGYYFASKISDGYDITKWFNNFIDNLVARFSGRPHLRVTHKKSTYQWRNAQRMDDYEYNKRKASEQEKLDEILEKISKKGYSSLTQEEKDFLFRQRNR